MRNEISANRRVLSFIVAFAIILSGFTNLITDYSYADSTKYKTVRIDGKEVDIKNADFNAQYDKEYEKTLKELQKLGYKTVNTKFDTKTETILSNSTSPEGNKKGKYLLEKQKWYWQTNWLSNASSGGNAEYTALIGLKNSITGETVNAYCIDLFTFLKNGSNYNNEYIELLEYNQNAFKGNADKLRTIALNSFPNKSLSELRKISGVDNLTEKEAVRASQYLIWSKAHGLNFQELYINNEDYGMGMKKSDKDYVLLSPQASSAAQTKANSARIYKLIQALDSIPVESQKTSVAEPKIDIRKVNFERNTNITDIKVSFEYKFDGENEDKTPLSQDFKYYVGDVELNASDIKNITYTGLTDGYNLVEFYLSPDNFKNNEDLKISVKAMQKIKIINALFSTTNNNKDTQTVITTQNIDSLRSVIKEATISSKENTDKYTVSFKKVDKDELDKASDNSNLSSALEGSKLQLLDYKNTPVNTVTTDTKGLAVFSNLRAGAYTLKEIEAPANYEKISEDMKVLVKEDGKVFIQANNTVYSSDEFILPIPNKVSQVQENIDFTVKKVWLNPLNKPIENHDYKLDIEIYRDGHRIGVKPIGQDGKVVFENMPKLNPSTNKPYNYTFEERNASIDIAQFISQERQGNEITFINRLRGGCFNFVKEDEKGAPLAGAVVGVYDARTNKLLFEGTTDSEGKLDNLTNGYQDRIKVDKRIVMELGNYYLKELKAPAGYELNDEKVEFTVEEYTCTPLLKIVNQKTQEEKLTLVVEKIWQDVTGTPIKDNNYEVIIEIYQDGNKIGEKKIIGNSTIEFDNLPKLDPKTNKPYNYEFKEKDPTVESTPVSKDTIGNKTTIISKLSSGELDFTKTEFSTDKAVAGATITIYRQNNDEIVVQGITDEQGKINNATVGANRIKNGKIVLEIGQYYFIETNAPKGYVLNDAKQPFEIKKDTVEKAKFENKKEQTQDTNIDFTVKKVWLNPLNKPIENHDYKLDIEIYRDGHRIGVKPIGQDGKVVFENMPKLDPATNKPYNYTFEERNASIDIAQFISQERQGNVITFTNRLRGGCFDFVKQDELGAPLAGAVVGVYDAKTDKLLFEGTTNDQGKLDNLTNGYQDRIKVDRRIVMELGNYYLKELKAPDGYELSDEKVEFTVNEYTCTPLLKIINRQTTGFATIINKDGSTQKPIPNGVFDIYKNANGQPSGPAIKIGLLIPESGTTIQLPYGDYIAVLVSPPTGGYELPNLIYDRYFTFTVDSSNTQNNPREVIVYHNKPSGPVNPTTSPVLYVTTIDEMRNPIGGATVEIYKKGETIPIIGGNTNIYGKLEEDSAYGSQKGNIQPDGRIELEFGDYEIKETNAPTGYIGPTDTKYISLTTENMIGIVELINKKDIPTPALISIIVNEKWINIESGKTSDDYKATVKLIRNGIEIDTVIITGDNSHTFDNLPKQDNNGQDYVYEVVQQLESGTREVSKTKQGEYVFDFVNEPMPSTAKGEVIVKYIVVDENGNPTGVVLSEEKLTGDVGVPYNTQQKEFDNYTFVKVDETKGPKSGEFKAQVQEVVYEYKQKSSNGGGGTNPPATKGTVKVNYIVVDENGNPTGETLEGPIVLTGEIGTAYNTVQKVFAGYEFVRVNPNKAPATGNFETTEQEVVYEYKKLPSIEGKVTVKYIVVDEKGNPTGQVLEGPTTIAGVVGTSYTTEQKSFTNYVFVRVNPDKAPATGNFETTEQEVVYEYKKVPSGQSKVTIKYIVIDENGNPTSQILEQTELIGTVGQQYITVQKDFTGYRFVKVDDTKAGVSGNFKVIDQEVIYQYKALGKVTIKYIVIDSNNNPTGQVLEGPTTITGEIGTAYNAEQKTFNGYTFVRVNPDKSTQNGNFKTTEQEVVFEYRVSTSGGSSSGGGGTGGTGGPSNSGNTNTTDNSTTQQSPRARIISEIVGTGNRSDSFNVSEEEVPKSVPDKIIRSLEDDNVPKSAPIMVSEVKSNNQPRLPKTGENNTTAMGFALLGLGLISLIKRRKTN